MDDKLCVRCGHLARVFAVIGDDRLCHGLGYPTCYEAALDAYDGTNWDLLKESWSQVQADTWITIEQLRRWHPDSDIATPVPPHFLASIGATE